ncbi:DUF2214 family protein [Lysobacter humi (ex Lee et al. 2017)]
MVLDFALAALHHVLFLGMAVMLATQAAILRGMPDGGAATRLSRLDAGYGLSAMLLVAVGALRVLYGVKGADFYLHNPWFHAKVGVFVLAAVISIPATRAYLRWRRLARDGAAPPAHEWRRSTRLVRLQLALLAAIVVLAAGMARHGGL